MKNDENQNNVIVTVYFEFENISSETCNVGMYGFTAYADDYLTK